ncbi:hypothetical protein [Sphingosinicella sp. BN140058]|uniref:hypothetical protein n=1 Tax=Sphingosinicella sp. BN140058 TaxID=1892855 RepID=UPI0013EA4F93|nr:hypothetical protein [Sphingosinicella sp. BN140058]
MTAPVPPFPAGSWFVLQGDDVGTLIELTPWGSILAPTIEGIGQDPEMRPHSGSHVLAGTPLSRRQVLAAAQRLSLVAALVDARLFEFIKIWVEDSFLLELLTPEQQPAYRSVFGMDPRATDQRLRALEGRA